MYEETKLEDNTYRIQHVHTTPHHYSSSVK